MTVFYSKAYLRMTYFVFHVFWYHLDLWGNIWSGLANSQSHIWKELFSKGQQHNCLWGLISGSDFTLSSGFTSVWLPGLLLKKKKKDKTSSGEKTQLPFNIKMDSLTPNNKADNFIWSSIYRNSSLEILPRKHFLTANNQLQRAPRKHQCPGLFWEPDSNCSFA